MLTPVAGPLIVVFDASCGVCEATVRFLERRAPAGTFRFVGNDEADNVAVESIRLLKRAISAQGFNLGVNLGRCAGAGLPGHVHQHVVPRWAGDTNFMSVVGEVRVVPQAMSQLYDELTRVREEMAK